MKLRVRLRVFSTALVSLLALPALFVACGTTAAPDAAVSPCENPSVISLPSCSSGVDRFSDEACAALDDRLSRGAATRDNAHAPTVTAPTEGQAIPAATPFQFRFDPPMALGPTRGVPFGAPRAMTLADELSRWSTLVPEAQAHCPVFSGVGYELSFKVSGRVVLRRQQSLTAWTPDAATWTQFTTAAGSNPVELTVYAATFSSTMIPTGSGPYAPTTPRTFTFSR